METDAKRRMKYTAYGNVAYAPAYDGTAARQLEREEVFQPRPKVRPRERVQARPRVRVREQGRISVFAVVGFLAVGIFAVLVLMSYVNLTTLSDETVSLRSELADLQTKEAKLLAQYELTYDLKTIEETVTANGEMIRPQSGQIYTIDLSEPDSVVRYEEQKPAAEAAGAFYGIKEVFLATVEYFR